MPGKVNPTQAEALTIVVVQVYRNDAAVAFAASQGNFELHVYKPSSSTRARVRAPPRGRLPQLHIHCAEGIEPDRERIAALVDRSLMLVTALNPHIGYDKAAAIAKKAHHEGTTLRDAALALGHVTAEQFDAWIDPSKMVGPG